MKKPTMEEVLEIVSFRRDDDGKLQVLNVHGNVGYVGGNVRAINGNIANVCGDVGYVEGNVRAVKGNVASVCGKILNK